MVQKDENIRLERTESVLIFFVLLLCLLIVNNLKGNTSEKERNKSSFESSLVRKDAVSFSGNEFPPYERLWISSKSRIHPLPFSKFSRVEDRKTDTRISLLKIILQNLDGTHLYTFRFQEYSDENDDLPDLG